jgi:hypothetical protein
MTRKTIEIDPHILEELEIAQMTVTQLLQTRAELEDLIDTLEILSSPEFRKSMDEALIEAGRKETIVFENIEELKTFLED